ncbi:MAG TPA: hypothetical protein VFL83_20380 [Anaeromyxobacter sp.]|nr:hypothetical protein [Anaeromyxobacter sp.]
MRKLAFASAFAAAALFAQGVRADDRSDKAEKKADEAAGEVKKGAKRVEQAGDRAVHGTGPANRADDRGSMGAGETGAPQARYGQQEKKHPLFEGKNNFDIEGKIQKASSTSITIQREELPAAELKVSKNTKIELDGEQASAQQLKPGQEVKASFNLNKDKAEAVEIKAEKSDEAQQRQR